MTTEHKTNKINIHHVGFTGGALIVGFFVWMFWLGWWQVLWEILK